MEDINDQVIKAFKRQLELNVKIFDTLERLGEHLENLEERIETLEYRVNIITTYDLKQIRRIEPELRWVQ